MPGDLVATYRDVPVLSAVVTPFLAYGAMSSLHQGGTQRTVAFASFAAFAFAGAFVWPGQIPIQEAK